MYLHVAEPPTIATHPQDFNVVQGNPARFTVQATGTEPLNYNWQWKPAAKEGRSGEWQPCPEEWCDGSKLTFLTLQESNQGSYRCVASNCAGEKISNPANLEVI